VSAEQKEEKQVDELCECPEDGSAWCAPCREEQDEEQRHYWRSRFADSDPYVVFRMLATESQERLEESSAARGRHPHPDLPNGAVSMAIYQEGDRVYQMALEELSKIRQIADALLDER